MIGPSCIVRFFLCVTCSFVAKVCITNIEIINTDVGKLYYMVIFMNDREVMWVHLILLQCIQMRVGAWLKANVSGLKENMSPRMK
jgi:hypothetical protein